jgi:hypothetical protein
MTSTTRTTTANDDAGPDKDIETDDEAVALAGLEDAEDERAESASTVEGEDGPERT